MAVKLKLNYSNKTPILDPNVVTEPTYIDVMLDFSIGYTRSKELLKEPEVTDIQSITDYGAVSRSLKNLFSTLPGQKILNPAYGLDFRRYLFEPLNERVGYIIGTELYSQVPFYEPRVKVLEVVVTVDYINDCYQIDMSYTVPSLLQKGPDLNRIKLSLSKTGFNIL